MTLKLHYSKALRAENVTCFMTTLINLNSFIYFISFIQKFISQKPITKLIVLNFTFSSVKINFHKYLSESLSLIIARFNKLA